METPPQQQAPPDAKLAELSAMFAALQSKVEALEKTEPTPEAAAKADAREIEDFARGSVYSPVMGGSRALRKSDEKELSSPAFPPIMGGSRPVGQHRKPEIERRSQQNLPGPAIEKLVKKPAETTGVEVLMYCWKEGKINKVRVICTAAPSPL